MPEQWTTDEPGVISPEQFSAFVSVCTTEYAKATDVLKHDGWTEDEIAMVLRTTP